MRSKKAAGPGKSSPTGPAALESYKDVLALLASGHKGEGDLLFIRNVRGVETLFQTISAVNAAASGAHDEEWNPLSQRPHSPLPPVVTQALGYEIRALKAAVDAFTTLAHEMMHVALWEPFFVGRWRPRSKRAFLEFSLLAEGYSFFFSDIVVSAAVRQRLPDGEYALERRTSDNAFFHPARAFQALGIESQEEILDIYLEAFRGQQTKLWQPRGTSAYAAALAEQIYEFFEGSIPALEDLHTAIESFGGMGEFHRRFCAIPGLPTFLDEKTAPGGTELKDYFTAFHQSGLAALDSLAPEQIARIRRRRMLQMRAYYALQVRWVLSEGLIFARGWTQPKSRRAIESINEYLKSLEALLKGLAKRSEGPDHLGRLDAAYDADVRAPLAAHDVWVSHRWMTIPRRAGGFISIADPAPVKDRDAKVALLRLSAYLVDELTRRMRDSKTVEERAAIMAEIQRIAALGAAANDSAAKTRVALRRLRADLVRPHVRDVWSVPLAGIEPGANRFRELVFSYQ